MLLRVRSITYLAEAVNGYELVDPRGRDLPRFGAGAHVAVRHGAGAVRDYSLWNDPAERRRYCIAVLREREGEGSRHWHEAVRVGDKQVGDAPQGIDALVLGAAVDRALQFGDKRLILEHVTPHTRHPSQPMSPLRSRAGFLAHLQSVNLRITHQNYVNTQPPIE